MKSKTTNLGDIPSDHWLYEVYVIFQKIIYKIVSIELKQEKYDYRNE